MPIPITRENVAGISAEWRQRYEEHGREMARIIGAGEVAHHDSAAPEFITEVVH